MLVSIPYFKYGMYLDDDDQSLSLALQFQLQEIEAEGEIRSGKWPDGSPPDCILWHLMLSRPS